MLFDFMAYVEELKENNEKKEIIEKYTKLFGTIEGTIKDQIWYKEYVTKFAVVEYSVPDQIKNDFDWDLLMQLVASSFSSEGLLDVSNENQEKAITSGEEPIKEATTNNSGDMKPEFVISVQSGEQVVIKKVSELWGFQILRLFEIYAEEQMNLQILMSEEEKEKEAIMAQRDSRMHRWQIVIDNLEKNHLQKIEQQEKDQKLQDLMNQL